jgi:phosphoglycolate phosphatase
MGNKVIIFDFDGTIVDSRKILINIVNDLADEFGYDKVTEEEAIRLSNLSSQDILRQSAIPLYKIPFLLRRVQREFNKHIVKLQPFAGIKEIVTSLQAQGYYLGIVTSNTQSNVVDFLEHNQLTCYFEFIYSANHIFGKDKIIKKLIKQYQLPLEQTFYVGDETRDIKAAKKSKIRVVAVTWGFNSAEVLAKYHPDFLIDQPAQLSQILS